MENTLLKIEPKLKNQLNQLQVELEDLERNYMTTDCLSSVERYAIAIAKVKAKISALGFSPRKTIWSR